MTPEYILQKSLCREPHCASGEWKRTAQCYIDNLEYCKEYADSQGYDNPKKGILFANWNYFPRDIDTILERYGFSVEWEDEWTRCDGCNKALRTSPNCYQWQPVYIQNTETGECFCHDCISKEDIACYEDKPQHAINLDGIDITKYGYREIKCGYESGWHPGQNADPVVIYNEMKQHGHSRLLFQINEVSQFYIKFCIWEKVQE